MCVYKKSKYDAFDRVSHTSRGYFALSLSVYCASVVSGAGWRRSNSVCDVTRRRAAAMYRTTQDARCRPVAAIPASVSNWSHQIACRRCYCVRRAAANNPPYDSGDSAPPVRAVRSELWQFIDCLMQCAVPSPPPSSSVSVSLSVGLCGLLAVMDGITSRSLRQILSSVGEPATSSSVVGLVGWHN